MPPNSGKKNAKKAAKSNPKPRGQQNDDDIDDILLEYQQKAAVSNHVVARRQHHSHQQRRQPPTPPDGFEHRWQLLWGSNEAISPREIKLSLLSDVAMGAGSKTGVEADAVYLFDTMFHRSPRFAEGWYAKGCYLSVRSDTHGAIVCFRNAVRFDPALLKAAVACLNEYASLCDYESIITRGDEFLAVAKQMSNRAKRARCQRKLLTTIIHSIARGNRMSQDDESYYLDLAEIVKEYPSAEALHALGLYMRQSAWRAWVLFSDEVDQLTEGEKMKRALAHFQECVAVPLEDHLEDYWLEEEALSPPVDKPYLDNAQARAHQQAAVAKVYHACVKHVKGQILVLISCMGDTIFIADELIACGNFAAAANNCVLNGRYDAALEIVDAHAEKGSSLSSALLYESGARAMFEGCLHLHEDDRTDVEVKAARERLFKYCRACEEIIVRETDPTSATFSPSAADLDYRMVQEGVLRVHSSALWGILVEAVETSDVKTTTEYFYTCVDYLVSVDADELTRLEFMRQSVEILSSATDKDILAFGVEMAAELKAMQAKTDEADDDEDPALHSDCGSPTSSKIIFEFLKEERPVRVAIRREEATERDEIEETTRRAMKKVKWKEQVNRRRGSPQGQQPMSSNVDDAVPPCRTTSKQRDAMCKLLEHASDVAAAVAVIDDEVLPQRMILFPRAVANDAVLTFTHALRPLHLHVHEVAAQLFNLSDDNNSAQPEERSVTVLRRGKAAPQTIVEVLSSVIAACERGFSMRSSGLKSFSLPMTGVPDGVWRRGGGGAEVPITEVVPSKGASLRVWGFQSLRQVRLRFVAKDGFHKPIGDSYRFGDCVASSNVSAVLIAD